MARVIIWLWLVAVLTSLNDLILMFNRQWKGRRNTSGNTFAYFLVSRRTLVGQLVNDLESLRTLDSCNLEHSSVRLWSTVVEKVESMCLKFYMDSHCSGRFKASVANDQSNKNRNTLKKAKSGVPAVQWILLGVTYSLALVVKKASMDEVKDNKAIIYA